MISETKVEPLSLHVLLRHNETLPFFLFISICKNKTNKHKEFMEIKSLEKKSAIKI